MKNKKNFANIYDDNISPIEKLSRTLRFNPQDDVIDELILDQAVLHVLEGNTLLAYPIFETLAEQGHAGSLFYLGEMFEEGTCVRKNLRKSFLYYKKAAIKGHPTAQCVLGYFYYNGERVFKNKNKALYWFKKAAEQGDKTAKENISNLSYECYIATCIYGSYHCLEVLTLRQFRDNVMIKNWYGRLLILFYYTFSPHIVRLFGKHKLFHRFWRPILGLIIQKINT
ncbi:MAG: sel1 repeat family protein [Candidatus Cloacimonetes bacterium]|nr:sel1 repeat family protein [Candidatus Cloacimonadota bacterium]